MSGYVALLVVVGLTRVVTQNHYASINSHVIDVLKYYSYLPDGRMESRDPLARSMAVVMNSFWRKVFKITSPVDTKMPDYMLADEPRRNMDLIRSVLDMPMNIVSLSCNGDVAENQCCNKIMKLSDTQMKLCPGYEEHRDFYEQTVELFTSEEFGQFDVYVRSYLKGSADDSVALIIAAELLESAPGHKFIEWGKNFTKGKFPCRQPSMMVLKNN